MPFGSFMVVAGVAGAAGAAGLEVGTGAGAGAEAISTFSEATVGMESCGLTCGRSC